MAQSFSASINKWVAESKERMVAVRNGAVEKLVEDAQRPVAAGGAMPIDTGFLRASIVGVVGTALPPMRDKPGEGVFTYNPGDLTLTLIGADLDDVLTIAWSARYARHVNYGTRGRPGRKFRDLAAQNWASHVKAAAAEVKARAGG